MIRIVAYDDSQPEAEISRILQRVLVNLENTGKTISNALTQTTRRHFQTIYPNSTHYSPDKVTNGSFTNGAIAQGETVIDVAGINRAFRDITIKPRFRKHLTIPMHKSAYGKRAGEFNDLFRIRKKDGKQFLVRMNGSKLTFMYFLAKQAFQRKDERLLPSDQTYCDNIFARIRANLMRSL